jgi:hypothetical protein
MSGDRTFPLTRIGSVKSRFVGLLAAVLACTAWELQAQDSELKYHLLAIKPPPPPDPPGPRAPVEDPGEEAAIITGRVTNERGQVEAEVFVRIKSAGVGDSTGVDGRYRIAVPRARISVEQPMVILATRAGLYPVGRTITLTPGARLTQDLRMEVLRLHMEGAGRARTEDAGLTTSKAEGAERRVSASSGLIRRKARSDGDPPLPMRTSIP